MQKFGILNITPDSFSDANRFLNHQNALTQAKLLSHKCDVIDVGAQSTRPSANIISADEELLRLGSVIKEISQFAKVSIDSFNYNTQQTAINQGALFINDVSAFINNHKILQEEASTQNIRFVFMHHLTIPAEKSTTMQTNGMEMVNEIKRWAFKKIEEFSLYNITKNRLIFDIGIGFGKTAKQDIFLIENAKEFLSLGVEIMVGHSRKSFMNEIKPNATIEERDVITRQITQDLSQNGIHWVRVHAP